MVFALLADLSAIERHVRALRRRRTDARARAALEGVLERHAAAVAIVLAVLRERGCAPTWRIADANDGLIGRAEAACEQVRRLIGVLQTCTAGDRADFGRLLAMDTTAGTNASTA